MIYPNTKAKTLLLEELDRLQCPMSLYDIRDFLEFHQIELAHSVAKELMWRLNEEGKVQFTNDWSIELRKPSPPSTRFYLATGMQNIEQARDTIRFLEDSGMKCTFNWSVDGSDSVECARWEVDAIRRSQCLVWIPWNSRGNHIEFGAAIAFQVPVIMLQLHDIEEISFYGLATHRISSLEELIPLMTGYGQD